MLLLVSMLNTLVAKEYYTNFFGKIPLIDPIIGAFFGSILAGSPVTSYVIGGELLVQGIGLVVVTAFLVAWVTVGVVQLPAESMMLGKKFAILRNVTAFIFSILVAVVTVFILNLIEAI